MKIRVTKGAAQGVHDAAPCTSPNHSKLFPHMTVTLAGGPWCVHPGEYEVIDEPGFGFDPDHIVDMRVEMASEREELPADWPASIVRRAAVLMTERLQAATKGPWCASPVYSPRSTATSAVYSHAHPAGSGEAQVIASARVGKGGLKRGADAEHIAALDPVVADLIADAWECQADDMADQLAHLHAVAGPGGWVVQDERERMRHDWTATVRAALAYLREDAPAVNQ